MLASLRTYDQKKPCWLHSFSCEVSVDVSELGVVPSPHRRRLVLEEGVFASVRLREVLECCQLPGSLPCAHSKLQSEGSAVGGCSVQF